MMSNQKVRHIIIGNEYMRMLRALVILWVLESILLYFEQCALRPRIVVRQHESRRPKEHFIQVIECPCHVHSVLVVIVVARIVGSRFPAVVKDEFLVGSYFPRDGLKLHIVAEYNGRVGLQTVNHGGAACRVSEPG